MLRYRENSMGSKSPDKPLSNVRVFALLLTTGCNDDPGPINEIAPWQVFSKPYEFNELADAIGELLTGTTATT